jgi:Fic family protein
LFIWQASDWPKFTWNQSQLMPLLAATRHEQGRLLGRMDALGFALREKATLSVLTQDVVKSSEIEGERLDSTQVRSSIARRLGIDIGALAPADRYVEGVVEMMLDATQNYLKPLTKERLCTWHAALFPTGRSGMSRIRVGTWRDDAKGPMQVVSGPIGKEKIHFTAPPANRLDTEISAFLDWFETHAAMDGVLKAAVAHLWFVTIHPFDDGNGRIARAIADMALARSEQSPQRFYSMSAQIQQERNNYYDMLERTQRDSLDITPWLVWFLGCLERAIIGAGGTLTLVMRKAEFWKTYAGVPLNERQIKVLNRLLDGFDGKLTSSKWATLAKCSQDTAIRDIAALLDLEILKKAPAGGRSTNYELADLSGP